LEVPFVPVLFTRSGATIIMLSGLEYCLNLEQLEAFNNDIMGLSSLTGLIKLKTLLLSNTNVRDIKALVGNKGLSSGDIVDLRGYPLSLKSIFAHIPKLKARGVNVYR